MNRNWVESGHVTQPWLLGAHAKTVKDKSTQLWI